MIKDFTTRLKQVLAYYDLTASAFADRVGTPRSSMSHLLSQRNKPSLEFVLKVVKAFPEIDLYWFLNGKGSFPSPLAGKQTDQRDAAPKQTLVSNTRQKENSHKKIKEIVFFYEDGTFGTYYPEK